MRVGSCRAGEVVVPRAVVTLDRLMVRRVCGNGCLQIYSVLRSLRRRRLLSGSALAAFLRGTARCIHVVPRGVGHVLPVPPLSDVVHLSFEAHIAQKAKHGAKAEGDHRGEDGNLNVLVAAAAGRLRGIILLRVCNHHVRRRSARGTRSGRRGAGQHKSWLRTLFPIGTFHETQKKDKTLKSQNNVQPIQRETNRVRSRWCRHCRVGLKRQNNTEHGTVSK